MVTLHLNYGVFLLRHAIRPVWNHAVQASDPDPGKGKPHLFFALLPSLFAVLLLALLFRKEAAASYFSFYIRYIGAPAAVLLPLLILLAGSLTGKHIRVLTSALLVILLVGGCGAKELEDRCFPMLTIVDYDVEKDKVGYTDTFPVPQKQEDRNEATGTTDTDFVYGKDFSDAWESYEKRLNKEPDYNHLKVLVVDEDFFAESAKYAEMIERIEENERLPRNAYVCVVSDANKFLKLSNSLSDDAGTYLEDFLENHKTGSHSPVTLGELIDEKENRKRTLLLPYLVIKKKNLLRDGYRMVDRGEPVAFRKSTDSCGVSYSCC